MRRGLTQQALAVLIVSVVIIVTLVGGVILALAEGATASTTPTPTLYHIPTLPLPTAVGESTHTATPTPEATAVVLPTSLPAPTATPTAPPTVTHTPTAAACEIVAGWVAYRIQPGDTLFLIGLRYGVTATTMLSANCLTTTLIHVGDMIYVPPVTPIPMTPGQESATVDPPADPIATGTVSATDGICTNPDSIIITPKVGAVLTGVTEIAGTAQVPDFAFYKIDIRQEGTQQPYVTFYTGHEQIANGVLAELNTAIWPNGEYWLRLVVVNSISNYPEPCAILVVFLN